MSARVGAASRPKKSALGAQSLPRLTELAEGRSPNISKAHRNLEMARMKLENARMAFLPSLDIQGIHGVKDAHPTTKAWQTPFTSSMGLTLTENLYDNGANLTKMRVAQMEFERLRLDFEFQRDTQLLAVAQAYYDWSGLVAQRRIDEEKRGLLRKQTSILDSQYKQGLKTKRDVLRIESESRRLEIGVITRDNDVDLAFQKLAAAVGVSREELESEGIEPEDPKPYIVFDDSLPLLKASDHRKAQIVDMNRRQAEEESKQVSRDYWPQVFLTGGLGYYMQDYVDTQAAWNQQHRYDWSALITIKYNIWDFGIRRRAREVAQINVRTKEDENRQTLLDLDSDLRDVWNRVREYSENFKICRELLALEQQSFSILDTEYRLGRAPYLDVITSLNSSYDARARFAAAYFGLRTQQMKYAFHRGNLYELLK